MMWSSRAETRSSSLVTRVGKGVDRSYSEEEQAFSGGEGQPLELRSEEGWDVIQSSAGTRKSSRGIDRAVEEDAPRRRSSSQSRPTLLGTPAPRPCRHFDEDVAEVRGTRTNANGPKKSSKGEAERLSREEHGGRAERRSTRRSEEGSALFSPPRRATNAIVNQAPEESDSEESVELLARPVRPSEARLGRQSLEESPKLDPRRSGKTGPQKDEGSAPRPSRLSTSEDVGERRAAEGPRRSSAQEAVPRRARRSLEERGDAGEGAPRRTAKATAGDLRRGPVEPGAEQRPTSTRPPKEEEGRHRSGSELPQEQVRSSLAQERAREGAAYLTSGRSSCQEAAEGRHRSAKTGCTPEPVTVCDQGGQRRCDVADRPPRKSRNDSEEDRFREQMTSPGGRSAGPVEDVRRAVGGGSRALDKGEGRRHTRNSEERRPSPFSVSPEGGRRSSKGRAVKSSSESEEDQSGGGLLQEEAAQMEDRRRPPVPSRASTSGQRLGTADTGRSSSAGTLARTSLSEKLRKDPGFLDAMPAVKEFVNLDEWAPEQVEGMVWRFGSLGAELVEPAGPLKKGRKQRLRAGDLLLYIGDHLVYGLKEAEIKLIWQRAQEVEDRFELRLGRPSQR